MHNDTVEALIDPQAFLIIVETISLSFVRSSLDNTKLHSNLGSLLGSKGDLAGSTKCGNRIVVSEVVNDLASRFIIFPPNKFVYIKNVDNFNFGFSKKL